MPSTQPRPSALAQRSVNVPTPKQPSAGQKRKADDSTAGPSDPAEVDCEGMMIDKNCDQVRRQIRTFLDSGEMTKKAFCQKICVTDHSLRTFLAQSGTMKGDQSNTYLHAWEFFKSRELCGIKMPSKTQKANPSETSKNNTSSSNVKAAGNSAGVDISNITLPREDSSDSVEVYDSCDEIRRKINAHLRGPGVTQAQFCRDMQAQLHSPSAPKMQSVMLTRFRGMHGPTHGNTSSVYYAAYVFFEKARIAQNKEKSKHRLGMEKAWVNRADRERNGGLFWCAPGKFPHEDEFGRVSVR